MSEVIFVTAGMLPTLCVPAALIRICGVAPTGIRVLQNRRAVRRVFSIALRPQGRRPNLARMPLRAFRRQRFAFYHPSSSKVTRRRRCFRRECTAPPRCSASAPPASSSRSTRSTCAGAVRIGQSREGERERHHESRKHHRRTQRTRTHTHACSSQCTHSRRGGHAQQILACSYFADRGPPGGRRRL